MCDEGVRKTIAEKRAVLKMRYAGLILTSVERSKCTREVSRITIPKQAYHPVEVRDYKARVSLLGGNDLEVSHLQK